MKRAGRLHAPELEAIAAPPRPRPPEDRAVIDERSETAAGGAGSLPRGIELRAPMPGIFVPSIAQGDLVTAGVVIGELVVLGRAIALVAPRAAGATAATGIAIQLAPTAHAVGYGDVLVTLDPSLSLAASARDQAPAVARSAVDGRVFRAPTSGRFYGRPAPDKPAFVAEGTQLAHGTTICLLEVMKTFHRVTYGGPDLPATARVIRVLVSDGDDVNAGDPLLALE